MRDGIASLRDTGRLFMKLTGEKAMRLQRCVNFVQECGSSLLGFVQPIRLRPTVFFSQVIGKSLATV